MRDKLNALTTIKPPEAPLVEPWEVSVAGIVKSMYDVPKVASKALEQFDRIGALRVTPTYLGFDNDDALWAKITVVHTRPLGDVLTETALRRKANDFAKRCRQSQEESGRSRRLRRSLVTYPKLRWRSRDRSR